MATGYVTPGGKDVFIEHELQEPAQTSDIVPGITQDSLASTSKSSDAGYITFFDKEEFNIYGASNTR